MIKVVYQNGTMPGTEYYIGEPTEQCTTQSEYKSSSLKTGEKWHYWLRSPYAYSDGSSVRSVDSDGCVGSSGACDGGSGVRPAFYLNLSSTSFVSGNGSEYSPYTVAGGTPYTPGTPDTPGTDPESDYVYKSGNFTSHFPGSDGTRESLSVYYDDSLFSEKSNKYNHRLAQYSLAMALAGLTQAPV